MTPLIIALVVLASDPGAAPAAQSPPDALAVLKEAQDNYDRALQLYKDSCEDRAYGAYDDLCGQLKQQVHQYRVDLDRQERRVEEQTKVGIPRTTPRSQD